MVQDRDQVQIYLRAFSQSTCNGHTLFLAARQGMGRAVLERLHAD